MTIVILKAAETGNLKFVYSSFIITRINLVFELLWKQRIELKIPKELYTLF